MIVFQLMLYYLLFTVMVKIGVGNNALNVLLIAIYYGIIQAKGSGKYGKNIKYICKSGTKYQRTGGSGTGKTWYTYV